LDQSQWRVCESEKEREQGGGEKERECRSGRRREREREREKLPRRRERVGAGVGEGERPSAPGTAGSARPRPRRSVAELPFPLQVARAAATAAVKDRRLRPALQSGARPCNSKSEHPTEIESLLRSLSFFRVSPPRPRCLALARLFPKRLCSSIFGNGPPVWSGPAHFAVIKFTDGAFSLLII
jgi:hypothetical protein